MQLVVTIYEETPEKAIDVIRALRDDHDAIELRVDAFGGQAPRHLPAGQPGPG